MTTPANRSLQLGPDRSRPSVDGTLTPRCRRHGLYGALWPMTLMLMFASGFRLWWLVFVPLVLGPILAGSPTCPGRAAPASSRRH